METSLVQLSPEQRLTSDGLQRHIRNLRVFDGDTYRCEDSDADRELEESHLTYMQSRLYVDHQLCFATYFSCFSDQPDTNSPHHRLTTSNMAPARIIEGPPSPPTEFEHEVCKPTVYLLDTFHPDATKHAQTLFNAISPGTPEHASWRKNAQYLLIRSSHLTAEDIAACPNLKAIGKQGVGIDKIDAAACAERGIKIFNTPGVNARAVAELVLSLATSVARDVPAINTKQQSGIRVPKEACSGLMLYQKTLGVIGMGNIGKTAAKIFRGAFEAPLIAYDPFAPADAWRDLPHTRAKTLEEVIEASDVITIHVPLTKETKDLIAYRELSLMKRNAIVINASRGGIVNECDLERALAEGLIWGAGLDCHEQEPPTKEKYSALWSQRVVSTPHIGAATAQTQMETAKAAVDFLHKHIFAGNVAK